MLSPVPRIVKHMTLAIMESRRKPFLEAFTIARARLVELKDLKKGSEEGTIDTIVMTPKGKERELEKKYDPKDKSKKFDWYLARYGKALMPKKTTPDAERVPKEDES